MKKEDYENTYGVVYCKTLEDKERLVKLINEHFHRNYSNDFLEYVPKIIRVMKDGTIKPIGGGYISFATWLQTSGVRYFTIDEFAANL